MGNLLEGEQLVYERQGKVVYARYFGRPDIPRWVISGDADGFTYSEFITMMDMANNDEIFKKEFDKLITLYYLKREEKKKCQHPSFL